MFFKERIRELSGDCKLVVLISNEIVFTSYLYKSLCTLLAKQAISQKLKNLLKSS